MGTVSNHPAPVRPLWPRLPRLWPRLRAAWDPRSIAPLPPSRHSHLPPPGDHYTLRLACARRVGARTWYSGGSWWTTLGRQWRWQAWPAATNDRQTGVLELRAVWQDACGLAAVAYEMIGEAIGEVQRAPYRLRWTAEPDTYALRAIATVRAGNQTASDPVTPTVP